MRKAARELVGVHNFRNLSSEKRGPSARNLMRLDLTEEKGIVVIDVRADGFLWNMVRKIATVLELVGSGERALAGVGRLLAPETNRGSPPLRRRADHDGRGVSGGKLEGRALLHEDGKGEALCRTEKGSGPGGGDGVLARSMEEFRG
jgi:hypothetical protein